MHAPIEHVVDVVSGEAAVSARPAARRLAEGLLDELGWVVPGLRAVRAMDEARRAETFATRMRLAVDAPVATRRMHALTRTLHDAPDLDSLFTRALEGAITLTGADFGNVQRPDEAAGGLVIAAESGFSTEFLEYFAVVRTDDVSACGRAAAGRAQTVIADVTADAAFAPHRGIAAASGFRAVQSTPLVDLGDELRGMISTHFRCAHRPSRRELELLSWYADHVAAVAAHLGNPTAADASTPDARDAAAVARYAESGLLLPARTHRRRDAHTAAGPRGRATPPRATRAPHPRPQPRRAARQRALLADLGRRALVDEPAALLTAAVTQVATVMDLELSYIAEASSADQESLAGYATTAAGPVISADLATEDRFARPSILADRDVRSAAAVVIQTGRGPCGVLIVAARKRRAFDGEDMTFLQGVANVLGCAVDADARVEQARDTERSRIARDLHDEVLSVLMDAVAHATIAGSLSTQPPDRKRWVEQAAVLQRVSRQVRGAIYDLRLDGHAECGFADRLGEVIAIEDRRAVRCRVELRGRECLPAASLGRPGTAVLQIVREAIANARRHSGATHVCVDAGASTAGRLRLEVNDDGDWPDRDAVMSGGHAGGIQGMLERARELQATLRVVGAPGGGTRVTLQLPLGGTDTVS